MITVGIRDIYPESFFRTILSSGVGFWGQQDLDLGTGTGVIPMTLALLSAEWCGIDASAGQNPEAQRHASGIEPPIQWFTADAEETGLRGGVFDAITAVLCRHSFNPERIIPEVLRLLKPEGRFLIGFMNSFPGADRIAAETEKRVLENNPQRTGGDGTTRNRESRRGARDTLMSCKPGTIARVFPLRGKLGADVSGPAGESVRLYHGKRLRYSMPVWHLGSKGKFPKSLKSCTKSFFGCWSRNWGVEDSI